MADIDKWEMCKKEIRSVLLPFQKGCYLTEFNRTYRELIGRRLPYVEFGFKTDIDFLSYMPDVVHITPCRNSECHLQGIADEKSKHIQKMVSRQKPAKLKAPPPQRIRYSVNNRYSNVGPRFYASQTTLLSDPRKALPLTASSQSQKTLHDPVNPKKALPLNSPIIPQKTNDPVCLPKQQSKSEMNLSPQEEVILLVQKFKNRIAMDDLLVEYKRMYNKSLSLSMYGFSSIEDCVDVIPELDIVKVNKVDFIVYRAEVKPDNGKNSQGVNSGSSAAKTPVSEFDSTFKSDNIGDQTDRLYSPSDSSYADAESFYEGNVPKSLRKKFQKIAETFTEGVLASDFPNYFEKVTSESLDILSLGYRCLNDLIDDVPHIFIRKPVAGSRKDYVIYPANKYKSDADNSLFIDHIVLNLRKILEAYTEGIKIKDILHIYSINCKDSLHIEDLGFDNMETFLASIKNSIPLSFGKINGEKSIHLQSIHNSSPFDFLYPASKTSQNEAIPADVASLDFKYKPLILPHNFNETEFIPVYVSSVANPQHLYIQFDPEGEDTFTKLAKAIESFYDGKESEAYMMRNIHITKGMSCIAKWPIDNHWYRSTILSNASVDTVKIYYVDYGTTDIIPTNLLRYAKKEFTDMPIQALKCRLNYLRPPKNAKSWTTSARTRILELCSNKLVMAKFEKGFDGIYNIILCDTSGDDDIYVNDVLKNEGLADYSSAVDEEQYMKQHFPPELTSPLPFEPVCQKFSLDFPLNLNPLNALQAQYFLQAFAATAPPFAQNEHYSVLAKEVSRYCSQITDPMKQIPGMPMMPPGFNIPSLNTNSWANSSALYNISASQFIKAPVEQVPIVNEPEKNVESDNEIFDDDNDEIFQQFCQKVTVSSPVRYVKRVILGDGYKIHIIIVDSAPYASIGDISQLIWNNKEAGYLLRRLEIKEVDIPSVSLSEVGHEELFEQLRRYNVKGVQNSNNKSSVLLFPLKSVIKILNTFGHPSISLRTKLTEEVATFNPRDSYWEEFSFDATESEDEDCVSGVTDDDKIERLCLHDLLAMKESIMCRKKKMNISGAFGSSSKRGEICKLELMEKKVLQRIKEIKEICDEFD